MEATKRIIPVFLALAAIQAAGAAGATVLFCPFDSLEGWSLRTVGAARAAVVEKAGAGRSLEVSSRRGTALLSRELPLEEARGCRVTVSCLVESEEVVRGPQASSTAKLHLAVQTPAGIQHHNARFVGTSDWHREAFVADVPADAERVVLNLGLEACLGKARFDRLIVRNDKRGVHPLSLASTANAHSSQLGVATVPEGTIQWEGIPFQIMDPADHDGQNCLRLKGIDHEDWPENTASPIPVNTGASAVYILHAALGGREKNETPCAIWTAHLLGGRTAAMSVFEGRQIGAVGHTEDLENWHVAWRTADEASGETVTFGVTKWTIFGGADEVIAALSCRAYYGAAPVILAVTAVEEPPRPPDPETEEYDEFGAPLDYQ
ncbi:MAG: hypothetical protein ACYTG0_25225 [Planctomycetota bacterium]|jgi:hypothetical protein